MITRTVISAIWKHSAQLLIIYVQSSAVDLLYAC